MRGVPEGSHGTRMADHLQENGQEPGWIYSVTFHASPGRRVHTFWFLDPDKAGRFYASVKGHPKVQDYRMYKTPVSEAGAYATGMEEGQILQVDDEDITKGWI